MFKLHDVDRTSNTNGFPVAASDGFTTADLIALGEIHSTANARRVWSRGQFVVSDFARSPGLR